MSEILDQPEKQPRALGRKLYKGRLAGLAWKLEEADKRIRQARTVIFIIVGLMLLQGMYEITTFPQQRVFIAIFYGGIIILYLFCGFFTLRYPIPSLGTALGIYLLILGLMLWAGGINALANGFIWKVVIVSFLSLGLFNAISAVSMRRKFEIIELEEMLKEQAEAKKKQENSKTNKA